MAGNRNYRPYDSKREFLIANLKGGFSYGIHEI